MNNIDQRFQALSEKIDILAERLEAQAKINDIIEDKLQDIAKRVSRLEREVSIE